jgi:hypothetical protein
MSEVDKQGAWCLVGEVDVGWLALVHPGGD